jgi:hypothetical protein
LQPLLLVEETVLLFASSLPFYTVRVNVGAVVLLLLLLSSSLSSLSSLSSSLICIKRSNQHAGTNRFAVHSTSKASTSSVCCSRTTCTDQSYQRYRYKLHTTVYCVRLYLYQYSYFDRPVQVVRNQ